MQDTIRNYFIPEHDLALLERALAVVHEACAGTPGYSRPDVQVAFEELKRIASDCRWGYGPFTSVEKLST